LIADILVVPADTPLTAEFLAPIFGQELESTQQYSERLQSEQLKFVQDLRVLLPEHWTRLALPLGFESKLRQHIMQLPGMHCMACALSLSLCLFLCLSL
jgi:hypothetical protein